MQGFGGGARTARRRVAAARSRAATRHERRLASPRTPPYPVASLPPVDVGGTDRRDSTRMLRAAVLALICALPAFAAAGCGGGASGSGETDPTSMVPAGVPVYIEASVRPEGELREDALAAAGKLLSTSDPAGRLRELLDKQLAEELPGASWERDLAPWLGEKAGVWVSGLDQREPTVAAIIASTDADAARAAIERLQKAGGGTRQSRTYKEVTYTLDDEGTAVGVVDDWVVTGSERGFKRTVDEREGDHLDGRRALRRRPSASSRRIGSATTTSIRAGCWTPRASRTRPRPPSSTSSSRSSRSTSSARSPVRSPPTARAWRSTPWSPTCPTGPCAGSPRWRSAARPSCSRASRATPGARSRRPRSARRWRSWSTRSPAHSAARP